MTLSSRPPATWRRFATPMARSSVGKRFNAFAAEQWLTADGDGRDPAQARAFDAPCDRLGCVAALPEGELLSIVLDRPRLRRRLLARASRGQRAQRARRLQGEVPVRRTGARTLRRDRPDVERQRLHAGERPEPDFRTVRGRPLLRRRATTGSCALATAARTAPTRPTRRSSGRGAIAAAVFVLGSIAGRCPEVVIVVAAG